MLTVEEAREKVLNSVTLLSVEKKHKETHFQGERRLVYTGFKGDFGSHRLLGDWLENIRQLT